MIYIVNQGDTLFSIARELGQSTGTNLSPERLAADNGLTPPYNLALGQALLVMLPETLYTVQPGDTLDTIASRFGTNKNTLWQNNPILQGGETIYPGQTLVISFLSEGPKSTATVTGYSYSFISSNVLNFTLPYLSYVIPFTYGFSQNADLVFSDDTRILERASVYGTGTLLHLSTLAANGQFDSGLASILLSSTELQDKLIGHIINTIEQKGYDGVDIDFEFVEAQYADEYSNFIARVNNALTPLGYITIVALAPKISDSQPGLLYEAHRYGPLGEAADGVLLMTYEWGYTYGPPMAVAPIDKVREVVMYALTRIPPEKILLGIPNYGYDWTLPFVRGTPARSISNVEAVQLASEYNAEILFDQRAQTPYFYYTDRQGREHAVWFEDPRSIQAKIDLIKEFSLWGAGVWNIYRQFPSMWLQIASQFNIDR